MKIQDRILLFVLAAIWGSSYLLLKIVTPVLGATGTMRVRIVIAAALMLLVFGFHKKLPAYKQNWHHYLVLGVLNLVLPFTLVSYSVTNLNSSLSAILNATTPLFTMVISSVWLKERLTTKKISGLLLALSGLIILVGWTPLQMNKDVIVSFMFSILAAVSYGFGSVYTKVFLKTAAPLQTATGQISMAALVVIPFTGGSFTHESYTPAIILAVLTLALVCTAIGYSLYFRLIRNIGSVNASVVTVLVPLFSLGWGVIFLHETVTPSLLAGMALIIGSLKMVFAPAKNVREYISTRASRKPATC